MQLNTIILFFLISFGLGYSVLWLAKAKSQQNPLLALIEMLGIGIAAFSFLGIILNVLHIPLNIWIYVALALVCPVIEVIFAFTGKSTSEEEQETMPEPFWKSQTSWCVLILLIICSIFFSVYHTGTFSYPYFEDDDPWNYVNGAMYVASEQTYTVDPLVRPIGGGYSLYLEPYPPAFPVMLGVLRQVNDSIYWTAKFFNVLLITIALLGFFLFSREYLKSDMKALLASFILAVLPSFMSHFIWAQSLAFIVYPVALYATLRALSHKEWIIPAIITVASALVTQPVISFFFGMTFLFIVASMGVHELYNKGTFRKRFANTITLVGIGAAGVAISCIYWGEQLVKLGLGGIMKIRGGDLPGRGGGWSSDYTLQHYTLSDVLFPPHASRIDQAVGWGWVVTLALLIGIVLIIIAYKRTLSPRKEWRYWPLFVWFAFLFYIVFSPSFGLPGYGSSRMWPVLALPLALIAAEGVFILAASIAKKNQLARLAIVVLFAIGIAATSVPAKIAVQTAQWGPGGQWQAPQVEIPAYVKMMQTIPKGSRVYPFCSGGQRALGFDMMSEPWNYEAALFRQRTVNLTSDEIISFLERHNYEYVTVDATCVVQYGENETTRIANTLTQTQRFQQVLSEPGFILARFVR